MTLPFRDARILADGPAGASDRGHHGYTTALTVSAGVFGLGVTLAILLLPSRQRLADLLASDKPRFAPGEQSRR